MDIHRQPFPQINAAYNSAFVPGKLTLGLVAPLDSYAVGAVPDLTRHIERVKLADALGFAAIWLRDVPFNVPSFGDVGQVFDPFVYLGALSMATSRIALGVASIILPLRHPAHVAKAAASVDVLSGGRLLLGVASGDRPEEYPAMNMDYPDRGERFRDSFDYIRAMADDFPNLNARQGSLGGSLDMLPKPDGTRLPLMITGGAQQSPAWVAAHGDGWITYPRDAAAQGQSVAAYRDRITEHKLPNKPVIQSLYVDLLADPDAAPHPIHLGFASGVNFLRTYLQDLQRHGINHVALNLRLNRADTEDTMAQIARDLLPEFGTEGA